jgi:hypothetical protein
VLISKESGSFLAAFQATSGKWGFSIKWRDELPLVRGH